MLLSSGLGGFSSAIFLSGEAGGAMTRPKREDILLGPVRTWAVPIDFFKAFASQHFLNFLPDPQGQGSFLPGLSIRYPFN